MVTHPGKRMPPTHLMRFGPESHAKWQRIDGLFRQVCENYHIEPPTAVGIYNALSPNGDGRELPIAIQGDYQAEVIFDSLEQIGWKPPNL